MVMRYGLNDDGQVTATTGRGYTYVFEASDVDKGDLAAVDGMVGYMIGVQAAAHDYDDPLATAVTTHMELLGAPLGAAMRVALEGARLLTELAPHMSMEELQETMAAGGEVLRLLQEGKR